MHVTILTNSLEVANEYLRSDKQNLVVVCTGGIVRKANRSLTGYLSQHVLNEFNPRKAFLSCYGLSISDGFTEGNIYDAEIKRLIVAKSHRSFFLIDHWKIGHVGPIRLGPLAIADVIITDGGIRGDELRELQSSAKEVIVASR